uniref:Uncharacterized protein n=1 Tax=Palpitomonas bilix TaxID=652834 RepID=A0A7S3CZS8_9EUKA|mmetsp:Transcript_16206/g.41035  ORF Transcript_16206/g.41035 Transcript_16206/m.41035 type:complete len:217 (+) Transcript_16206:456-1106(+)|eukprot:CAMPEP_0113899154 /NCGR_PEP_ID=MMETSP0780_2-20120614/19835_1 /TAXON_ID=652834 /ORGANISM="Palpitomonas bilix" /LENGTH=216 /DNA_ID=CAMNT_0000891213 /DNA_START=456 /DNA_END=1106 /DNA_ORIENTATION=- /assembly_acc=CAM_ASM_000599
MRYTIIARASTAGGKPLPLVANQGADPELNILREQARQLLARASPSGSSVALEADGHYFIFLHERNVIFLTAAQRSYPRKLAVQYLDEVKKEFFSTYSDADVAKATRSFEFVRFDNFLKKTEKVYSDLRAQNNIEKLQGDLTEVHRIMSQNIKEVLGRGEQLDSAAQKSSMLAEGSRRYKDKARAVNRMYLLRKWLPFIAVFGVIALVLLVRSYWS